MPPLMITKLLPPRIGGALIERPRLLAQFSLNNHAKLIMITAPAGYGKTVATLQYINARGMPFVWYQLDDYDNDPAVFIQYLIAGIQAHYPGFGTEALQLSFSRNIASSLRFLVIALVNELAGLTGRDLALVLDDYHVITAPLIHQFMRELLEHLPAGIHFIIASRTPPDLPLARFGAQGEIGRIDGDALRFTLPEVNEYVVKRQVNASPEWIDFLIARTEGWPAALTLLTGADFETEPALPGKETRYIYDYLTKEVFERLPEATRNFLLSSAVLEIITPEMCDLLLERSDSGLVLADLEKRQLFLMPLAGPEKAFRYHQLFRDFLIERLGPRRNRFLRKAGAIIAQNGNLDQAIEYYLAAGIEPDWLPLLERAGKEAFRHGRWQTVERWLGMMSWQQIAAHEWLSFFQAQIKIYQGKLDEAETWLSKSLAGFATRQDASGVAECQFLQARILNGHGRHRDSLCLLEKAYPVLQHSEAVLRFDLPLEMAITLFRNGRFREAEELLTRALEAAEEQSEFWIMAHLLEGLGHINYWIGEHGKALQCYKKGIRISPGHTLPSYNFQDFIASIYLEWGELDRAFEYALRSVTMKENLGMREALPTAYYQLGSIYADRGDFAKAEECYGKGIDLAENGGGLHFLSLNKAYLANCLCMQGRLVESQAVAEEVLALARTQSETLLATVQVLCASTYIRNGDLARAEHMLSEALHPLEKWQFAKPLSYGYANLAVVYFESGDLQRAGQLSRKLLNLAARKNLIRLFLAIPEYRVILRYGLENGIEIPFVQRILVRLGERGVNLLSEMTSAPDPQVRTRTMLPLSQINTPAAQELLAQFHNDPEPEIGRAAQRYVNPAAGSVPQKTVSLLQINLLGPVRIILNNTDITAVNWRFNKSRDLLLYLAHQGQPVRINRILEDLWPDFAFKKGINNFYSALYWLRQFIQKSTGVELVTYAAKTCQLLPAAYTTDRDRFISLINAGCGEIENSGENVRALAEAVALYQGEYLNQLDYPWVIPEREYIKRLFLETVVRLAKIHLRNQDYLETVKILESVTEQNPLFEDIFGLLMSAYAKLGDRLAVIRQYQKLKSNLAEELGLEPTPAITKLYYQLCGSAGEPGNG